MKTKYIWMEVSDDGLLKMPEDVGPYYSTENVNPPFGGHESQKEAIERLKKFHKDHPRCPDLILVKKYCKCT